MKTLRSSLALFAALIGLAAVAVAQTQSAEAVVLKVVGSATIQMPGGVPTPLESGAKVAKDAVIVTGAGSEVYLQTHTGTVATVKPGTTVAVEELSVTRQGGKVTEEKTTLSLRSGNLVSALDPAKRNVNNYQVRTPKGVAAARGTTFTVSYNGVDYTIVATTGSVQITASTGGIVNISGGQASLSNVGGGAATAIADLPAEQKAEVIQAMAVAVATIAVANDNNMLGASGTAELRDATATVLAAAPEAAATVAALVNASAPSQTSTVVETTRDVAPSQSAAVDQAVRDSTPPPSSVPPTPTTPEPSRDTTTPQPIDPSVISRSS